MSRGGITSREVENPVLALGDNEYETGLINVSGNSTIKRGTVLKRDGDKFAPVTNTTENSEEGVTADKPVAVNPFDIENKQATAADLSICALISGKVRADLLTINGETTTDDQNDLLRAMSIIPIKLNDISRTE